MLAMIRQRLADIFDEETCEDIPLLYGGSVDTGNTQSLLREPDIDGLFIGRAAWSCDGFLKILELTEQQFAKA